MLVRHINRRRAVEKLRKFLSDRMLYGRSATRTVVLGDEDAAASHDGGGGGGGYVESFARLCESSKLVGLDCEWVSGGCDGVALLQLAEPSGRSLLVRLCKLRPPPAVLRILRNPDVLKLGVAVGEDASNLEAGNGLPVDGWVDIRHVVREHRPGARKLGVVALAEVLLDVRLKKNWRISASDWAADRLDPTQVEYAANDAYVAVSSMMSLALDLLAAGDGSGEALDHELLARSCWRICEKYRKLPFTNKP